MRSCNLVETGSGPSASFRRTDETFSHSNRGKLMAYSKFPTRKSAQKWAFENINPDSKGMIVIKEFSNWYVYYKPEQLKKDDPMQDFNYVGHRIHY